MPVVSVTRLRLRSIWYLLPFAFRASAAGKQAQRSTGCHGVLTRKTRGLAFWTLTMWEDEKSMRSFVAKSPHREMMPELPAWCDEAAVAHWVQEARVLPGWKDATQKMLEGGRLLRLAHPSAAHRNGEINVT
jgi:heme-degrading monooxygenase HmoA